VGEGEVRIKIFRDHKPSDLETRMNEFAQNPKIHVVDMSVLLYVSSAEMLVGTVTYRELPV
jgi:hypothetical protein